VKNFALISQLLELILYQPLQYTYVTNITNPICPVSVSKLHSSNPVLLKESAGADLSSLAPMISQPTGIDKPSFGLSPLSESHGSL
jgi:hypothetical protein